MKKLLALFLIFAMMFSLFALTACDSDKNNDGDDAGDTDDADKDDGKDDGKDDAAKLETETFTIGCMKYDVPKGYTMMGDPSENLNGVDFTGLHMDMTTGTSVSASAQVTEGDEIDLPATQAEAEELAMDIMGVDGGNVLEDVEATLISGLGFRVTFKMNAEGMTLYYTMYIVSKTDGEKITELKLIIGELDEARTVGLAANPR